MIDQKHALFRQKSLERLSSPERLDQLMQVVSPKSWLPLLSLGSLVVVAGIWSVKGRIPITIEGRGVLIYPSKVVTIQSKSSGQLSSLNVQVGEVVKKGQILGTINQVELRKQLQQQRDKLAELQSQNQAAGSLEQLQTDQEKRAIEQQRQYLQQRILELQNLTPVLKVKSSNSLEQQRQAINQRVREAQALIPVLKKRLEIRKYLFVKGTRC
jgi:HlyD family secretion protein